MAGRYVRNAEGWSVTIRGASSLALAALFASSCADEADRTDTRSPSPAVHYRAELAKASIDLPPAARSPATVVTSRIRAEETAALVRKERRVTPAYSEHSRYEPDVATHIAELPSPTAEPQLPDEPVVATAMVAAASLGHEAPVIERAIAMHETESTAFVPQITEPVRAAYIAQVTPPDTETRLALRWDGEVIGNVEFQIAEGVVSVHIGQVLDLFEDRMDAARFAELRGSSAAQQFVALDRLQGAGIPIQYNAAYDELTLDNLGA